jgi:hypothetical protein
MNKTELLELISHIPADNEVNLIMDRSRVGDKGEYDPPVEEGDVLEVTETGYMQDVGHVLFVRRVEDDNPTS